MDMDNFHIRLNWAFLIVILRYMINYELIYNGLQNFKQN